MADAQKALIDAQAQLTADTTSLNVAQAKLNDAQTAYDQAKSDYDTAKDAQDKADADLKAAKDEQTALLQKETLAKQVAEQQAKLAAQAQAQAQAKANGVNGQVVDANGNSVAGWTVKNGQAFGLEGNAVLLETASMKSEAAKAQGKSQTTTKTLPQTGNNVGATLALAGLGMITVIAGVLGFRKREN